MSSDVSQNVSPFNWNQRSLEAAQLLAEDKLTQEEIGVRLGVTRRTLSRWLNHPEFRAKVDAFVQAIEAAVFRRGIAGRVNRIRALDDRWQRMKTVLEERGVDPTLATVPGGKTGLLVRQIKGVGSGDNFQLVHEYAVDTGLLRELREHEKQTAQELGQWTEQRRVEGDLAIQIIEELTDEDETVDDSAPSDSAGIPQE